MYSLRILQSVQFSHSVISDSLQPHGLQHARPLCPSPTPRVYPNSSITSVMPSNDLILCLPLLLLSSIFPSISNLSSESVLPIRWPNYWSFSFSISPFPALCRLYMTQLLSWPPGPPLPSVYASSLFSVHHHVASFKICPSPGRQPVFCFPT